MAFELAAAVLAELDSGAADNDFLTAQAAMRQVIPYAYGCVQFTPATAGLKIATADTQKLGFYGATTVVRPTALTTQLTTVTFTAPGTPDYAIAPLTQTTPFGFTTADEGHTVLSVIANLQTRVSELEAKLGSTSGLGLITASA